MRKIRLFVSNQNLQNDIIKIIPDFHYLINVMRLRVGDQFLAFNGQDGEWLAEIISINKKDCDAQIKEKLKDQYFPPKITLAFAPVKNARIDFIVEKGTELGIANFQPILTKHCVVDKVNPERFSANIKEAVEQCERLDLPSFQNMLKLKEYLKSISQNAVLILADESGKGIKSSEALKNINAQDKEIIIFTGPEGGFSKEEFDLFYSFPNLISINLGPRILRADTAIISAITLVQEFLGDFNLKCRFYSML